MKKNKLIGVLGIFLLLFCFLYKNICLATETDCDKSVLLGDVNLDDYLKADDALIILKYAAKLCELEGVSKELADANNDLVINSADALCVLKRISGLDNPIKISTTKKDGQIVYEIFKKNEFKNADAKLTKNGIATSINRVLTFLDFKGDIVKQYEDINVSWLDVNEEVIVYANNNKEVGICIIDENFNILSNNIIMNIEERLGIDPTICKVGNDYYITVTHITGTVNNGNPNGQNGNYSVRLYKSSDLESWICVSEVLNCNSNLEDIDLNYYDGEFVLSYEKETFDKLNSSICVVTSNDMGKTWSESLVLIEANSDNEPADLVKYANMYCLYYSSDIDEPGGSYETAKIYNQFFDKDFNKIGDSIEVPLINQNGNLLYDVYIDGDTIKYLFTEKYISQSNLVLEEVRYLSLIHD